MAVSLIYGVAVPRVGSQIRGCRACLSKPPMTGQSSALETSKVTDLASPLVYALVSRLAGRFPSLIGVMDSRCGVYKMRIMNLGHKFRRNISWTFIKRARSKQHANIKQTRRRGSKSLNIKARDCEPAMSTSYDLDENATQVPNSEIQEAMTGCKYGVV